MDNTIKHLEHEFQGIRAGKASPAMLNGVMVEYYGTTVPIEQTANIGCTDARMIVVQPFDKSALGNIAKAILNANLGFNPINNGEILRISVPALTEERRKELVKRTKNAAEEAKVGIRGIRRNANDDAKKLEKDVISEDESKLLQFSIAISNSLPNGKPKHCACLGMMLASDMPGTMLASMKNTPSSLTM